MLKALALVLMLLPVAAQAAGTDVAFNGLKTDPTLPVQVTADQLSVNQNDGTALFKGNVVVTQGSMTLAAATVQVTADQLSVNQNDGTALFKGNVVVTQGSMTLAAATVQVQYGPDKKTIAKLLADGGVKLVAGTDAASSQTAEYAPETGDLLLTGDVILTQAASAISGQKLTLSLKTGLGTMDGRVTTTFTPAKPKKN